VTVTELVKKVSVETGFTQKDVETTLKATFDIIQKTLLNGERVTVRKKFTIRPFVVKGYLINGRTKVEPHIRCSFELKRR